MRSTLALLLLFGAFIGIVADTCTLYTLPERDPCTIEIRWMVHNDAQATAVCLEYFPTTFVKGVMLTKDTIKCSVAAAYQCVPKPGGDNSDTFLMFDKCYYFPRKAGVYVDGTVKEYEEWTNPANHAEGRKLCNGGKLSVFYSHTHAKFVGMKANVLGINKLWIGITKDGRSIEEPDKMIHSALWKVVESHYWDVDGQGKDVLVPIADKDNVPATANYYFLRTRSDPFNARFQGSFERASKNVRARFACEFEAKFTAHQEWYCEKLGVLGMAAQFDVVNKDKPRCLYLTANKYAWTGDVADMNNIKGCQEKPSDLHSVGLDDGTADPEVYKKLAYQGKLRIAGYRDTTSYTSYKQDKCGGSIKPTLYQQWRHLSHKGKIMGPGVTSLSWDSSYPANECSDFPGESTTMGVKLGQKVDMPTEVRAPAICSLIFFQECENKNPCDAKLECTNTNTFQDVTRGNPAKGFFTCNCPGEGKAYDIDMSGTSPKCTWKHPNWRCAWMRYNDGSEKPYAEFDGDIWPNDQLNQVVVHEGCKVTIRAHFNGHTTQYDIATDLGYGTHEIPNDSAGKLVKEVRGYGASSAVCKC